VNPNRPASLVTDAALDEARGRVAAAVERLREAEQADPVMSGWDAEYDAAATAARAAERRLEALERLRAAQVERGGKREAAVQAAAPDLAEAAKVLTASRERVADAARQHLQALAGLAAAVDSHNQLLAGQRAKVAGLGLAVRDDLVDEHGEHGEGVLDRAGLRAGDTDWTPVQPGSLEAHALRLVFDAYSPMHPLAGVGKYQWRPHEVEARADGLRVPGLGDVRSGPPPVPPRMPRIDRPPINVDSRPPGLMVSNPGWQPTPSEPSKRRGRG
jgi:hypothetical protein